MIELHFSPTPNCWKVAIMLEETGLAYRVVHYDLFKGEHLTAAYRSINPNLKVPAIVDRDTGADPVTVFETGAILYYLAEKTKQFLPQDISPRMQVLQWLTWQVAGLGPMMGQASHFMRYAPDRHEYSISRYAKECDRLFNVLEFRLRQSQFLADDYSIADIATWPLVKTSGLIGIDLANFPAVKRWWTEIGTRPAIARVFESRETAIDETYLREQRPLSGDEWSNTYGERMLAASKAG